LGQESDAPRADVDEGTTVRATGGRCRNCAATMRAVGWWEVLNLGTASSRFHIRNAGPLMRCVQA
jgi:hypothetical protein